jgi:hypothetical protein
MYKVGDKVLIEVEIVEVDKEDEWLTYQIEFDDDNYWISPKDIVSLSTKSIETPLVEQEEVSELKYKKEWGIGEIELIDTSIVDCDYVDDSYDVEYNLNLPYLVRYPELKNSSNGESYSDIWYTKESNIELVTEEN